jgi:hypothetical protein
MVECNTRNDPVEPLNLKHIITRSIINTSMSKLFSMNFIEMMVAVWYILKANHELKTPPDIPYQ